MLPSRACLPIGLAAAALCAGPALAQDNPRPRDNDNEIVVTGQEQKKPPTSSEVSRQAREITDGRDLRHSPLARFTDRLCPGIMGLRQEAAETMIDRIRDNAEELDMWMASDVDCTPNMIVAFVENGQADLQRIAETHHWMFDSLSMDERRKLLAETGPARAWTTVVVKTRDGVPVPESKSLFAPPEVNTWMAHSKIYLPIQNDIGRVIVLFDREGVKGKTLRQLADYATMRGLARTRPVDAAGQPMDTILALFDPDNSPPFEMTSFDKAYLASIYDGIPNIAGITKVTGVNRQLRKQEEAETRER